MTKRVLIIGGYGIFGGRLARLLADEEKLTLVIAGRSKTKSADFCNSFSSHAQKEPLFFDRDKDIENQLSKIAPDIVIDATGPFELHLVVRNWSFLGLPMPSFLKPDNNSYEFAENGVFHFHVEIGHPLTGSIVRYRGQLTSCA